MLVDGVGVVQISGIVTNPLGEAEPIVERRRNVGDKMATSDLAALSRGMGRPSV